MCCDEFRDKRREAAASDDTEDGVPAGELAVPPECGLVPEGVLVGWCAQTAHVIGTTSVANISVVVPPAAKVAGSSSAPLPLKEIEVATDTDKKEAAKICDSVEETEKKTMQGAMDKKKHVSFKIINARADLGKSIHKTIEALDDKDRSCYRMGLERPVGGQDFPMGTGSPPTKRRG